MKTDRSIVRRTAAILGGCAALACLAPDDPAAARVAAAKATSAKARLEVATKAIDVLRQLRKLGEQADVEGGLVPLTWSRRMFEARHDLATTKAERVAAAEQFRDRVKTYETSVSTAHRDGQAAILQVLDAQYQLAQAEELVARAQGE